MRTVDSDVVVLAIAFFDQLNLSQLWIGFGSGKKYRDVPVHDLHSKLGTSRSRALALFHALSGCDTTSQLLGCGKKTAWGVWQSMPELTETLIALIDNPDSFAMDSIHMERLERFHVLMHSKSCSAATVNEAAFFTWLTVSRGYSLPPRLLCLKVKSEKVNPPCMFHLEAGCPMSPGST